MKKKLHLSDLVFGLIVKMSLLPTSVSVLLFRFIFTDFYNISIDFFFMECDFLWNFRLHVAFIHEIEICTK